MKKPFLVLCVLLALQSYAIAGYYGGMRINEYDPITGLYYKAIDIERKSRGFISKGPSTQVTNISIFDPKDEKHALLFNDSKIRDIQAVLFETGVEDGVLSYSASSHSQRIKNNHQATSRKPKDKLLVSVRVSSNDQVFTELWLSNKKGEGLTLIDTFPASYDWHIDVKNSKIRIVSSMNGQFTQKSIDW